MSHNASTITVGLKGQKSVATSAEMSALSMGSGSVKDTFATPAMLALMEGAAVTAIEPLLAENEASVGIAVNFKHLAATPIGNTIRAEAVVTAIAGRKISFEITVHDEHELVGQGTHDRVIIDRERFAKGLAKKQK